MEGYMDPGCQVDQDVEDNLRMLWVKVSASTTVTQEREAWRVGVGQNPF